MKVVIGSLSPVKKEAVQKGFSQLFPTPFFEYECVNANSGVSNQPMSSDEMRQGALGRISHARELSIGADFYVALEGGVEHVHGDLHNSGWVVVESANKRRGFGRAPSFALPPAIKKLMLEEGLEQSHATDVVLSKSGTKVSTGTIGPLTNDVLTYLDWYVPAVICALVPFVRTDLYEE